MLEYDLSLRGDQPLYAYLYRCIRTDILSGVLASGDRLPSKRSLARSLGVSQITVESAYAQLVAEGYVRARDRSGYYVCPLPARQHEVGLRASGEAAGGGVDFGGRVHFAGRDVEDPSTSVASALYDAGLDADAARLWSRAVRAVLTAESEREVFSLSPAQGMPRLRRALAGHLRRTRGMEVDPECIVVGAGAQLLNNMLVQLLGPSCVYGVEDPGYARLTHIYRANGARVRHVPLDSEGPSIRALQDKGVDVFHLMPSHQFPTGRVTGIARRYELLGWAASGDSRYLIEDDYDCEFRLAGRPIPPLAAMDAEGRVVYMNTFSRSLGAALRLAYMVLPRELMDRYASELGFYSSTVSSVDQIALARILEDGSYERYVARMRKRARDARDYLQDALSMLIAAGDVRLEAADAGLHAVVAVRTPLSEGRVSDLCRDGLLAPMSSFAWCRENADAKDGLRRFVVRYGSFEESGAHAIAKCLQRVVEGEVAE